MTENAQFRPQLLIKLCSGCIIILFIIASHNNEKEEEEFSKYSRFLSFCHTYTHSRHTNLFHEGQEREGVRGAFRKKISDISCYCDQFYLHIGDLQKIKLTGGLGRINSVSHLLIILYTTRVSDAINECSVQYVKYIREYVV